MKGWVLMQYIFACLMHSVSRCCKMYRLCDVLCVQSRKQARSLRLRGSRQCSGQGPRQTRPLHWCWWYKKLRYTTCRASTRCWRWWRRKVVAVKYCRPSVSTERHFTSTDDVTFYSLIGCVCFLSTSIMFTCQQKGLMECSMQRWGHGLEILVWRSWDLFWKTLASKISGKVLLLSEMENWTSRCETSLSNFTSLYAIVGAHQKCACSPTAAMPCTLSLSLTYQGRSVLDLKSKVSFLSWENFGRSQSHFWQRKTWSLGFRKTRKRNWGRQWMARHSICWYMKPVDTGHVFLSRVLCAVSRHWIEEDGKNGLLDVLVTGSTNV